MKQLEDEMVMMKEQKMMQDNTLQYITNERCYV